MNRLVETIAVVMALGAALLAAALGAWQDLPILILAVRALVAAVVVFAFVRVGGEMAVRTLLRSVAEEELDREAGRQAASSNQTPTADRKAA
jgi:hypothetical protein